MNAIRMPVKRKVAPLKPKEQPMQGLGDAFKKIVADPIVNAMPKWIRTQIQGCGGCEKRRQLMNEMFPFKHKDAT
jgi:hypothetical protein